MKTWYHTRAGWVAIRAMHPSHLINALLKLLSEGRDWEASPLAAEVKRRGLESQAMDVARRRMGR